MTNSDFVLIDFYIIFC